MNTATEINPIVAISPTSTLAVLTLPRQDARRRARRVAHAVLHLADSDQAPSALSEAVKNLLKWPDGDPSPYDPQGWIGAAERCDSEVCSEVRMMKDDDFISYLDTQAKCEDRSPTFRRTAEILSCLVHYARHQNLNAASWKPKIASQSLSQVDDPLFSLDTDFARSVLHDDGHYNRCHDVGITLAGRSENRPANPAAVHGNAGPAATDAIGDDVSDEGL